MSKVSPSGSERCIPSGLCGSVSASVHPASVTDMFHSFPLNHPAWPEDKHRHETTREKVHMCP